MGTSREKAAWGPALGVAEPFGASAPGSPCHAGVHMVFRGRSLPPGHPSLSSLRCATNLHGDTPGRVWEAVGSRPAGLRSVGTDAGGGAPAARTAAARPLAVTHSQHRE